MKGSAQLGFATIAELARRIEDLTLSPVELTKALLERIDRHEPKLHAFIAITAERALEDARRAEREITGGDYRGPLHGIPYALKDIYETAGIETTACSRIYQGYVPSADATTTRRLHEAGGVLLGKLVTHEFAHGGPSFDLPWPPARNPWNFDHVTGGSSSGSGAAVAAGLTPVALGTDTGGSIRSPAGLCGLVGLKPTYGLVSRSGVIANSYSYDHCGPLTRSVEDAAIVLQCLAGHDPSDPASAEVTVPNYRSALTGNLKGMTIGVIRHFYEDDAPVSSEVHTAMEAAIGVLRGLGARVTEVRLRPLSIYQDIKVTQAEPEVFSIHQADLRGRPENYGEDFRGRVLPACLIGARDYLAASRERARVVAEMQPIYAHCDALLTVGPGPAPRFGGWRVIDFWQSGSITAPFNVTGGPALVQCMGFTKKGLPMSLQLTGRPFDDATVLQVADAYERETRWLDRRPNLSGAPGGPMPDVPAPAKASLSAAERDTVATIATRAGLNLGERDFEQLCASAPYVSSRVDRVSRARELCEPPTHIFHHHRSKLGILP